MSSQGHDDYSIERVPVDAKQPTWKITMVRMGCVACIPMLMVGATLGYSMKFWDGFLALVLGSVILQIVGWAVGTIAATEGLSTSLIARWAGFGKFGSSLIGAIIAIVSFGWFGIQNSVFAEGLFQSTGILNFTIWAIITGVGTTLIVVYGIKIMNITAIIALPLFLIGVIWAFGIMLAKSQVGGLTTEAAPGPILPLTAAIVMVAGGFMMGAVYTPDYSRFLRNGKQVFWMVLISTFGGELGIGVLAMLMAHAVKSADIVTIMLSLSGILGVMLVVFATIKANDINLYSGSLGITNFFNLAFGVRWNRATVTLITGVIGTILSVLGVLNFFINFMTILGTYLPPVAAIIVVDYYILKRNRQILDESREVGQLPGKVEIWNPVSIIAWIIGGLCGQFITWGIPSITSLVVGGLSYFVLIKIYASAKGTSTFKTTETKDAV